MRFRRWVVFTFLVHALVVVADKSAGLVLYFLTKDQQEQHGAASLLASLPFILMALANMGLATSLVYHVRRGLYTAQQAMETALVVAFAWGGLIAGLAYVVTMYVLPLIRPEWSVSGWLLGPICLGVPLLLVMSYANSIQLATDRIRGYNLVHLFSSLAFLPLFLLAWWLWGKNAPLGVAWGRLAATGLVEVLAVLMIRKVVRLRPKLHREFLGDSIRYGWRANLTSVLTYLNHRIDLFVVAMLFVPLAPDIAELANAMVADDAALSMPEALIEAKKELVLGQVAFYSMAVTFAEMVWHFPEAMRDLFFSKVAGSTADRARVLTPTLVRISTVISVVAGVGIYLVVDPVMAVVTELLPGKGNAWNATWSGPVNEAMIWLIPGTVGFTIAKVLQADMMARNLTSQCVRGCWVVFVVMVGLDLLWVPSGGAAGAAQASSVAYLASSLYMLIVYKRDTGVRLRDCVLLRRSDLGYLTDIVKSVWSKILRR